MTQTILHPAAWLLILAAFFYGLAHAVPTFKANTQDGGQMVLQLLEEPCTNEKVLQHIQPEHQFRFKAAKLKWGGADWASCWAEAGGTVFSIDEAGSPLQPIPRRLFRDDNV